MEHENAYVDAGLWPWLGDFVPCFRPQLALEMLTLFIGNSLDAWSGCACLDAYSGVGAGRMATLSPNPEILNRRDGGMKHEMFEQHDRDRGQLWITLLHPMSGMGFHWYEDPSCSVTATVRWLFSGKMQAVPTFSPSAGNVEEEHRKKRLRKGTKSCWECRCAPDIFWGSYSNRI